MVKTKAARRRHLVKALRSGKYTQGRGCLEAARDIGAAPAGSNCCLGVGCRVAIEDGLDIKVEVDDGVVRFNGEGGMLPDSVMNWYGFATSNGMYRSNGEHTSLISNNDDDLMTFEQIADVIESEPEGLFVD